MTSIFVVVQVVLLCHLLLQVESTSGVIGKRTSLYVAYYDGGSPVIELLDTPPYHDEKCRMS